MIRRTEPSPRQGTAASEDIDTSDPTVQHWARVTARRIILEHAVTSGTVTSGTTLKHACDSTVKWWKLAVGKTEQVPPSGQARSRLTRAKRGSTKFFVKRFDSRDEGWRLNELSTLMFLATQESNRGHDLREHYGWMYGLRRDTKLAELDTVETVDSGPSLGSWLCFCPTSQVNGWPVPLFAQADFLAALVQKALIGLGELSKVGVIHNDIHERNICLELPELTRSGQFWAGKLNLRNLAVRFIDFETAYRPDFKRFTRQPSPWNSPVAQQAWMETVHAQRQQAAELLGQINAGCDLWSLGDCLSLWHAAAADYWQRWGEAAGSHWGEDSPLAKEAQDLGYEQAGMLAGLDDFVRRLKAYDGVPEANQPTKLHGDLRAELESAFPILISNDAKAERVFSLIDPEAPIELKPPQPNWLTRHAALAAKVTSGLVVLALAVAAMPKLVSVVDGRVREAASHYADTYIQSDQPNARFALELAQLWDARIASAAVLEVLRRQPEISSVEVANPAAVTQHWGRSLRGLRLWWEHLGPRRYEHFAPGEEVALRRLLSNASLTDNGRVKLGATTLLGEEVKLMRDVLPALWSMHRGGWHQASLLAAHWQACYSNSPADRDVSELLGTLLASDPRGSFSEFLLRAQAVAMKRSLEEGKGACLLKQERAAVQKDNATLHMQPEQAEASAAVDGNSHRRTDRYQAQYIPGSVPAWPSSRVLEGVVYSDGNGNTFEQHSLGHPTPGVRTSRRFSDLQELIVPDCGEACPTFIVLPTHSPVTMGTGAEARVLRLESRIAMSKTHVTVGQWRAFIQESGYELKDKPIHRTHCDWQKMAISDLHPVRCVNAADAEAYAAWFSTKYRQTLGVKSVALPTADELEYAARAGRWTQVRLWDGDSKENCAYAASLNCTGDKPARAASHKTPNAWGLYDTVGNLQVWTATETGKDWRMLAGASHNGVSDNLRFDNRNSIEDYPRLPFIGFRLRAAVDE